MAIALWNSTEKGGFVPGMGPNLSRGGVPLVPGTVPVCPVHRMKGLAPEKKDPQVGGSRSDQGSAIPALHGEEAPKTLVLQYFGASERAEDPRLTSPVFLNSHFLGLLFTKSLRSVIFPPVILGPETQRTLLY